MRNTHFISVSAIMDPGLSLRAQKLLPEFTPGAPPPPQRQFDPDTTIDLSYAVNELVHPQLLEFFKSTVEDNVTSEVGLCLSMLCNPLTVHAGVRITIHIFQWRKSSTAQRTGRVLQHLLRPNPRCKARTYCSYNRSN
jgi:hypothetical protein